jgi:hypothetical protein
MARIIQAVSKLYIFHFVSFAISILILWFLARYRDSFPYNYAVLGIWAVALLLTVASAGAMIIDQSELSSEEKNRTVCIKFKCGKDLEAGLEMNVFDRSTNLDLGSILMIRRSHEITQAALVTILLSTVLVFLGLHFGSSIFQAEASSSIWRSSFVVCWIYAGIMESYPQSERAHRFIISSQSLS